MRLILFAITLLCIVSNSPLALSAQGHEPEIEQGSKSAHEAKPQRFKGFAQFRKGFQAICEQIFLDGRGERLVSILKKGPPAQGCAACRSLYSDFASACRPPKIKPVPKPKKDEPPAPTATPIFRQRDPSAKVIEYTVTLFRAMSERSETELISEAVDQLCQSMSERGDKSPGEYDYFATWATYIRAPFVAETQHSGAGEVAPRPTVDVDALFDD